MGIYFNQKYQTTRRQSLRNNSTDLERILWVHIKQNQLEYRFRRQFGIGPYIVDFYCPKKRLVIEVDGDSHFTSEGKEYDKIRSGYIHSYGTRIIRFTNQEVRRNLEGVLDVIRINLERTPCRPPSKGGHE